MQAVDAAIHDVTGQALAVDEGIQGDASLGSHRHGHEWGGDAI